MIYIFPAWLIRMKIATLTFIVSLFAAVIFVSGCVGQSGNICPDEPGMIVCGYCNEDAVLSDNPNAGKCRYCAEGSTCSFTDICGDLKCVGSSGSAGTGGTKQYCGTGYCYSGGVCCPKATPYNCNNYCYNQAGANSHGCYTLKTICY